MEEQDCTRKEQRATHRLTYSYPLSLSPVLTIASAVSVTICAVRDPVILSPEQPKASHEFQPLSAAVLVSV